MQPLFPSRRSSAVISANSSRLAFRIPVFVRVGAVLALALALFGAGCGANVCFSSPTILSTAPTVVTSRGSGLTMTVNGNGFTPSMQVLVNGNDRPFQFVSNTQILVLINSGELATPGSIRIVVQSRDFNGMCRVSSSVTVTVT